MNIDKPDKTQIAGLRALWREAFGDTDEFLDVFFATAFSPERCACVTIGDDVAAALYWFNCECNDKRVAYIYAVATAKAYRGQKLCHKLMEYTHKTLKESGYSGAVLVPVSPSLFGFYGGMGYETCSYVSESECVAGSDEVKIRKIEKDEYAKLRRMHLPDGGVIQENENLDFLETQAEFYAGDGFVVASRVENGKFYGVEFLGDSGKIPSVLKALGHNTGQFRTVGNDRPFAMYRPINEDNPPTYFGLAFD
ncbi:MAG: GNAT family N-acetyltransferase [Clostridia bacterium]|nr:GNAT family N-acetyltransferase [Clostridia bacterium]